MLGGQGDGAAAAQIRQRAAEQWRAQKPDELENVVELHAGRLGDAAR